MVEVVESEETPPVRYRRLLADLAFARREAGGELPASVEARWIDAIDRCWWAMTDTERLAFEQRLGQTIAKKFLRRKRVVKARGRLTFRQWLQEEHLVPRWLVWAVLAVDAGLLVQAVFELVKW